MSNDLRKIGIRKFSLYFHVHTFTRVISNATDNNFGFDHFLISLEISHEATKRKQSLYDVIFDFQLFLKTKLFFPIGEENYNFVNNVPS